ncbi:aldehyde dehydrogenase family protein [Variovorax sp. LjRoot178]|uniref:aldehyde dehydrogenase family protein n=1 Tax=Variovorax sp. LjRoot178 TaxID=3342277 RepID=UPI003ECE9291
MKNYDKCYIDGAWVKPASTTPFQLIDPATEEVFARVQLAGKAEVDQAVVAARRAFNAFSRTSKAQRLELLRAIVAKFQQREADVAAAITQEMGAPSGNKGMTGGAIDAFKQAIVTLGEYEFETRESGNLIRREPIGVCGLITAWNWPAQLIATKLSMAIAAGCTTIIKPSEFTPISAILITEILHEAGVPKGVVNLVIGDGPTVGNAISAHPDIDMVSFTGSTRAGTLVAQAAAPTVKRVSQELGGKSAHVILPDADLKAAAAWNVARAFHNTGQSCHAPTRVLVQESQRDEVVAHLVAESAKVRIGAPTDPGTTMGPVVNKAQFERVQRYIGIGLQEGATLACGGPGRPDGLERGYFVKPTVFADVTPHMTIAQEEIFGPVLSVITYKDLDEAVEIANGTVYGLGGYVYAGDLRKGYEIASRLRAGRVFLNGTASNPAAPMGGYKQSGNGREMGVFGLEEYLEVKAMIGFPEAAVKG